MATINNMVMTALTIRIIVRISTKSVEDTIIEAGVATKTITAIETTIKIISNSNNTNMATSIIRTNLDKATTHNSMVANR